ncbi:hypothetical protein C9439_08005 [archaeon SCG-AAA382B04]|nr:hypothetical protein C9439_08005 [archaeon SCG-AAA382B04]
MDIEKSLLLKGCVVCILLLMMGTLLFVSSATGQNEKKVPVIVEEVQFSDKEPMEGDNITIGATINNTIPQSFDNLTIIYYVDNIEIGNITGIKMNASASKTFNITWEAKEGNHGISAVLKGNTIQNNKESKELYVEPEPIGDIFSLILSLGIIILIILGVIIIQSILKNL